MSFKPSECFDRMEEKQNPSEITLLRAEIDSLCQQFAMQQECYEIETQNLKSRLDTMIVKLASKDAEIKELTVTRELRRFQHEYAQADTARLDWLSKSTSDMEEYAECWACWEGGTLREAIDAARGVN